MVQEKRARAKPAAESRPEGALLELKTLAPRDYMRIDGETYELIDVDALDLIQRSRVNALITRINTLQELASPSEADSREFDAKLRELSAIALPTAPAKVLATLKVGELLDLSMSFFAWVVARSPRQTLLSRIGVKPSPGSNGSMEVTP
jgi:hypothetical protein